MKKLLFLLMLLPVSGFAQFKYITLNSQYAVDDKMSKKEIPVYLTKAEAPKNIVTIGIISCDGFNDEKRFRKAKKMAAKHGATGLYVISPQEETENIKNALGRRHAHETRYIAFVVKD